MVRPTQRLYPQREPAATLPAATVLLLRERPGTAGFEVLMTRRSLKASFAPGAYVFPGGGIDEADTVAHPLAQRRAGQDDAALTAAIAAIRESFEELGIVLARAADGRWPAAQDLAGLDRHAPFAPQIAQRGWTLAADAIAPLAHWTTDRDLPRRFEVDFLVALCPPDQEPAADEREQFEPIWIAPSEALARHATGDFFIIFPTIRTLERMANYPSAQAVMDDALKRGPLWRSCPRAGMDGTQEVRFMEHEAPYGELELTSPDGQIVHRLDWRHEPVGLLGNVMRLTAPNPGMMTGPGTNTYIVGTPDSGYAVIDPGPDDAAHIARIHGATGGDVRVILCTHSHADHSPGARPLQALCARAPHGQPAIVGLPSAPTARAASQFTPDRPLQNGELTVLTGRSLSADLIEKHSLKAVFTPGHAANHVCFVLLEDGLLFSGDHILNGSTTIVDPPDGNMAAYLDSLDELAGQCVAHDVQFILPAHGHVLGQPQAVIAHLKAHRLKREAKVIAAMRALPGAGPDAWVPLAYDDTPQRLWPVAKRSLLAHVERIEALGLAGG